MTRLLVQVFLALYENDVKWTECVCLKFQCKYQKPQIMRDAEEQNVK